MKSVRSGLLVYFSGFPRVYSNKTSWLILYFFKLRIMNFTNLLCDLN